MKAPEFTDFPDISHDLTIFPVFLIFSETLHYMYKNGIATYYLTLVLGK